MEGAAFGCNGKMQSSQGKMPIGKQRNFFNAGKRFVGITFLGFTVTKKKLKSYLLANEQTFHLTTFEHEDFSDVLNFKCFFADNNIVKQNT